ncbi:MAG: hypothetical protein FWG61_05030 [Firmicutes bacterium]|nr:hypothetical protein [Bacillota bacterium]
MQGAENITWEYCRAVTEEILSRLEEPQEAIINGLNRGNGIYFVAYTGTELGGGSLWGEQKPRVVFIGQSKYNSSRHFQSGTTGSSTIRRSLAALLANKLELVSLPRSTDEEDNDRYDNYMLDPKSEDKLTEWMRDNFTLAFYEVSEDIVGDTLKSLIQYSIPMFNFQNNPENKYGAEIKIYRKRLAEEAYQNEKMQASSFV